MREKLRKKIFYYLACELRYGQSVFNAVANVDAELAGSLRGTNIDCYYIDENSYKFLYYCFCYWRDKNNGSL